MNSGGQPIRQEGFAFSFDPSACMDCNGRCCRGASGAVFVNGPELETIAAHLQQNIIDFSNTCLERRGNRLVLREERTETESICLFFDTAHNRCLIYPVRPAQCRSFPFWDYFRQNPAAAAAECPGILPEK